MVAPAVVLAVVVVLFVLDCIPNAMNNPLFTVCAGGLASVAVIVPSAEVEHSIEGDPEGALPACGDEGCLEQA
jgi:hypothetical protein